MPVNPDAEHIFITIVHFKPIIKPNVNKNTINIINLNTFLHLTNRIFFENLSQIKVNMFLNSSSEKYRVNAPKDIVKYMSPF